MPDVGTAYLQIVPSMDGVPGSIRRGLGGEADAAGVMAGGRISGKIKGALAASGIGTALGAGLAKSIKTGANLEQAIGGIETLFKDSADEMIKNADNAFKTAGISANQYMEQATSFSASLLQSLDGDTQKAAKAAGDKNMELIAVKELLPLTGYIRGGCSPVGMKKKFPTYLDETCILWEEIAVSAGARGHQLILDPEGLVRLISAELADIIV